jgi:hypothetical protein
MRGSSRLPGVRRRWIVLVALLALVLSFAWLQGKATWIYYYRVADDHTLAIGVTGPPSWTRVTELTETASTVIVGVSSSAVPLPGYSDNSIELTVHLNDTLDGRTVIDASSGQAILLTKCSWPSYLAPGCT